MPSKYAILVFVLMSCGAPHDEDFAPLDHTHDFEPPAVVGDGDGDEPSGLGGQVDDETGGASSGGQPEPQAGGSSSGGVSFAGGAPSSGGAPGDGGSDGAGGERRCVWTWYPSCGSYGPRESIPNLFTNANCTGAAVGLTLRIDLTEEHLYCVQGPSQFPVVIDEAYYLLGRYTGPVWLLNSEGVCFEYPPSPFMFHLLGAQLTDAELAAVPPEGCAF